MPKLNSSLKASLAESFAKATTPKEPLWKGPEVDGVTQSLLGRFLCDREKFRLYVVEGLRPQEGFNHRLEYGNLWHTCEEALAAGKDWNPPLLAYGKELMKRFKEDGKEVNKYFQLCKLQFPIYVDYWKKHRDVKKRVPVFQEQTFSVLYKLPSGRVVRLRGKFDAVDSIEKKLWIQENKSKSEINRPKITAELPFDLQSMVYLTALTEMRILSEVKGSPSKPLPVAGIRYNVIKRPLSPGKFSIVQHKGRGKDLKGAETEEEFYSRLSSLIKDNGEFFFDRFNMEVTPGELKAFQRMCLNPILEQLCDWWESIKDDPFNPWETLTRFNNGMERRVSNRHHFVFPYGVWNPALEGRTGDYDTMVLTGDSRGLERVETLYRELA